jgi:hypothetical protein
LTEAPPKSLIELGNFIEAAGERNVADLHPVLPSLVKPHRVLVCSRSRSVKLKPVSREQVRHIWPRFPMRLATCSTENPALAKQRLISAMTACGRPEASRRGDLRRISPSAQRQRGQTSSVVLTWFWSSGSSGSPGENH